MMSGVLQALGLSREAAEAYAFLLRSGSCDVQELPSRIGLPAERARKTVNMLVEVRLARLGARTGTGQRVWPVAPRIGLTAALARRRAVALRMQAEVEQLDVEVAEIIAAHETQPRNPPATGAHYLEAATSAAVCVYELAMEAQAEILLLSPRPDETGLTCVIGETAAELARRGVRVRQIHLGSIRNRQDEYVSAEQRAALGIQVRTTPVLPMELMIVDGESAVLPDDQDGEDGGAAVLRHPGTIVGLSALFEQYWQRAEPLGGGSDRDVHGLTAAERELLAQLAEGATDETAARRMGVSLRTVRRMAAHLMEQLDARSRFQAGCRASAYGWLGTGTSVTMPDPAGRPAPGRATLPAQLMHVAAGTG